MEPKIHASFLQSINMPYMISEESTKRKETPTSNDGITEVARGAVEKLTDSPQQMKKKPALESRTVVPSGALPLNPTALSLPFPRVIQPANAPTQKIPAVPTSPSRDNCGYRALVRSKQTFPNGVVQEGDFEIRMFFRGKVTFPNGKIQEGDFENGRFVRGKVTFPDGKIQEGDFENGRLVRGKVTFPDGQVQEGDFVNITLVRGKVTFPSGKIQEGDFENGRFVRGKVTFPDGTVREVGAKVS